MKHGIADCRDEYIRRMDLIEKILEKA
jgi:hypothetical protein